MRIKKQHPAFRGIRERPCTQLSEPLTVIGHQTLAGSQQQVNFSPSRLDQLDGPRVSDALRGLTVDLHDLIAHLRGTS